jgi:hypothetical protein
MNFSLHLRLGVPGYEENSEEIVTTVIRNLSSNISFSLPISVLCLLDVLCPLRQTPGKSSSWHPSRSTKEQDDHDTFGSDLAVHQIG